MDVKMKKFGVNYGEFTSDYYVYSLINKLKEISFDSDEILIDYIFDEDEVVHSDEFKLIIRDVAIEIIGDEIEYVTVNGLDDDEVKNEDSIDSIVRRIIRESFNRYSYDN